MCIGAVYVAICNSVTFYTGVLNWLQTWCVIISSFMWSIAFWNAMLRQSETNGLLVLDTKAVRFDMILILWDPKTIFDAVLNTVLSCCQGISMIILLYSILSSVPWYIQQWIRAPLWLLQEILVPSPAGLTKEICCHLIRSDSNASPPVLQRWNGI